MGVIPAAPDSMSTALAAGHDVALWPGGEVDSLRPWVKRDEAVLAGRKGFIRLAIKTGVPIVPIATVGGPDSMPVITSGRRLAKVLQLDKVARIKVMPIALSAPWGLSPAMLPEIPFPTKIRTAFQEPVELDEDPDRAGDDAYVDAKYEEVRGSIQTGMDALARRRRLPLFG
jgi:1-acyl-sn-glycerol-3-phosphate acyltransferase